MASNHCRNEQLSVPIRGGWWVEILGHLDGVSAWLREESNKNKTLWKQKLRTSGGAVQLSQSNQRSLRKKNLFL
ncbi:hypothetical protein NC653_006259 [Populus alba x Populus x berolinensis]|uniref:Uncharacterized protein n=1 Tax=Populus alba x Populus x berolinensis TaxID=444605 RepID=A0AAD6RDZ5_9ROSI|nr:hypothetical protein NC653_006259 [Populus alba x Populus x berolinensis]